MEEDLASWGCESCDPHLDVVGSFGLSVHHQETVVQVLLRPPPEEETQEQEEEEEPQKEEETHKIGRTLIINTIHTIYFSMIFLLELSCLSFKVDSDQKRYKIKNKSKLKLILIIF